MIHPSPAAPIFLKFSGRRLCERTKNVTINVAVNVNAHSDVYVNVHDCDDRITDIPSNSPPYYCPNDPSYYNPNDLSCFHS